MRQVRLVLLVLERPVRLDPRAATDRRVRQVRLVLLVLERPVRLDLWAATDRQVRQVRLDLLVLERRVRLVYRVQQVPPEALRVKRVQLEYRVISARQVQLVLLVLERRVRLDLQAVTDRQVRPVRLDLLVLERRVRLVYRVQQVPPEVLRVKRVRREYRVI